MGQSLVDIAVGDIAVLLKYTVDVGRLHGEGQEPWSVLSESKDPIDVFVCKNCQTGVEVNIAACVSTVRKQLYYKNEKDK